MITNDGTIQHNKLVVKITKMHTLIYSFSFENIHDFKQNASRDVLGPLPICKNIEENLNMCPLFC